jgi:hypothetical protein
MLLPTLKVRQIIPDTTRGWRLRPLKAHGFLDVLVKDPFIKDPFADNMPVQASIPVNAIAEMSWRHSEEKLPYYGEEGVNWNCVETSYNDMKLVWCVANSSLRRYELFFIRAPVFCKKEELKQLKKLEKIF